MAATLLAVNERAHVDLSDDDIGAEPICVPDNDSADLPESLKETIRREGIGALAFFPLIAERELIAYHACYAECQRKLKSEPLE